MRFVLTISSSCSHFVFKGARLCPQERSECFVNDSAQRWRSSVLSNTKAREGGDNLAVGPDTSVHLRRDDADVGSASLPSPPVLPVRASNRNYNGSPLYREARGSLPFGLGTPVAPTGPLNDGFSRSESCLSAKCVARRGLRKQGGWDAGGTRPLRGNPSVGRLRSLINYFICPLCGRMSMSGWCNPCKR